MNVFKSRLLGVIITSLFTITTLNAQKELVISGGNTVSSLVCANRKVYVWGSNANGQLGLPGTGNITLPTAMPNGTFGGKDIQQVNSGSGAHFVALDCDGSVWAWGGNADGQIGNGTTGGVVTTPVQVTADPEILATNRSATGKLINASVVYSGTSNSFAILKDGRLVSWGKNDNTGGAFCAGCQAGQLGHGTTTSTNVAKYVRIDATTVLQNVIQVFAGDNVAYALVDPDGDGVGTVYSWGDGNNGTLGRNAAGNGNPASNAQIQSSFARPVYYANGTPMNNIIQLQAGDVFGIALDVNNYVWTWGNGGWNNATGNTTINYTGSDPRRVIAGTTTGASNDGTYLLAKAIGGGQGYGMAVTVDGKPVAWGGTGGCVDGGMTGTGTTTAGIPPTYIQYGPNQVHNNVTLINRGDTWGFYGTANNEFYAWGCNTYGQLGVGSTTDQTRAVKITPPSGCGLRDPFPFLDLSPGDTIVCQSEFTGLLLKSGFVPAPGLDKSYQITWYKDGSLVKGNASSTMATEAGVSINGTYQAITNGKYKVVIKYIGNNGGCVEYPIVEDSLDIKYFPQTFTAPTNLTYCGDSSVVNVISTSTSNGKYTWYPTNTSTTPLGNTIGSGTKKISVATITATTGNPKTKTVYVEETSFATGAVMPTQPCTAPTGTENSNLNSRYVRVVIYEDVTLDSLSVIYCNADGNSRVGQNFTWQASVFQSMVNTNGVIVPNTTGPETNGATISVAGLAGNTCRPTPLRIPVNIALKGSPTGRVYFIRIKQGTDYKLFNCTVSYPVADNVAGEKLVEFTGTNEFGNAGGVSEYKSPFFNLTFSTAQRYCNRVPVVLTELCPCNKPKSVTISAPATTPYTICEGSALTLKGTYVDGGKPIVSGINYLWYKLPNQAAIVAGDYKVVPVADKVFATTVAATDSGKWVLRVEDGTAKTASCYTEDTIHIKIDKPVVAGVISKDTTLCYGVNAPAFTVKTATTGGNGKTPTYQWYQSPKSPINFTKITGATSATYDPAVLNDTTLFYRRDSSGVCNSKNTNTVQVNMLKELKGGKVGRDTSICTGTAPVAFKEEAVATGGDLNYKYQWQSATALAGPYADIATATGKTYASGNLTQTTYFRRIVRTTKPVCADAYSDTIVVTVISKNTPGVISKDESICSGTKASIITSTSGAVGSTTPTYYWRYQEQGTTTWTTITRATANKDTLHPGILTKTTSFKRIANTGAGSCNTDTSNIVTITVYPDGNPGTIGRDTTICDGQSPKTFVPSVAPSGGNGTYTYKWVSSTNGSTYGTASLGTASTFTSGALNVTTYFKRIVTSGNCPADSGNAIKVAVLPKVSPGTIGNDTSICQGSAPKKLKEFVAATGGNGTYKYQWKISTDGVNFTNISGAPGTAKELVAVETIDTVTYYRRDVVSGTCDTMRSNVVKVTPIKGFFGGKVLGGNEYCSQVTGVTINDDVANPAKPPIGTTPSYFWIYKVGNNGAWQQIAGQTSLSLNMPSLQLNDTSYFQRVVVVGPGKCDTSGSNVITFNIYKQTVAADIVKDTTICSGNDLGAFGINPIMDTEGNGVYTWRWQSSTDNGANWSGDLASTSTFNPPALTATTLYRRLVKSGVCAEVGDTVTITVNPALTPGSIEKDQLICANTSPAKLTELTASTGGGTTNYTYRWYTSADGLAFDTITSTNVKEYSPNALAVATWFKRETRFGTCAPALSNAVKISILPGIVPGVIGTSKTICYNSSVGTLTNTTSASGGNPSDVPVYSWLYSLNNGTTWDSVATNAVDYAPAGNLTTPMLYKRKVVIGTSQCNTAYTQPVLIKVFAPFSGGSIDSAQTICQNTQPKLLFERTGAKGGDTTSAYTYVWENSTTGIGNWIQLASTNSANYQPPVQQDTIYFRRKVSSANGCGKDSSNIIKINVVENAPVSVTLTNPVACEFESIKYKATPVNGGATPKYQWFINGSVQPETDTTLVRTNLKNGDIVKVLLTSSIKCTVNATSTAQTGADIVSIFAPYINIAQPIESCQGNLVTLTTDSVRTGGNSTFEWFVNGVSKGITTAFSPLSQSFNNGDKVKIAVTSDLKCAVPKMDTSTAVSLVVYPIPTPDIIELSDTICEGSTLNYTVHNTKGALKWFKDGFAILNQTDSTITISEPGAYSVEESRKNGLCPVKSDTIVVTVIPIPVANAGTDQYVLDGDIVTLNGSGGGLYSWSPADSLTGPSNIANPKFLAKQNISFTLTVMDSTQTCSSTDNVMIFVERPIIIVNTFSPNGDGVNDGWVIRNIESFPKCLVKIYNRWGSLVWQSHSYPNPWDGTNMYNDQVLPDGTYFYIIELNSTIFKNPYQGWVQIVR